DRARWRLTAAQARLSMRRRRRYGAALRGPRSPRFNQWLDQSRADVALLTTDLPTGRYPYAGIPWFSTPFGRDAIITAWQMLWLDPGLAEGVLTYLAANQATEVSAFKDSAPGKIMHETRAGEMSALGEVPFRQYYGGGDTTCLFIALARGPGRRRPPAHRGPAGDPAHRAQSGGRRRLDARPWRLQRRRLHRLCARGRDRPVQPGLEGQRGFHLPPQRPVPQGPGGPAGGAGLRLRRLAGAGRPGPAAGRPARRRMAPTGHQPAPAARGAFLDGGPELLRHRPGRGRRPVPVGGLQRRAPAVHRPAHARTGPAGDRTAAVDRVPYRLGAADPGGRPGALQSDVLPQRLGVAARYGRLRRRHGPLRRARRGGPDAIGAVRCGGPFPHAPARAVLRLQRTAGRAADPLSGRLPAAGLGGRLGLPHAAGQP